VQAEDEIASLGMVIGASWAGARSMTSTAGPGISLMAEFAGLAYYAETPGVIFDIQRVGPSTGLPTRTAQGDIATTAFLSHGDTKHIMLIPSLGRRVLRRWRWTRSISPSSSRRRLRDERPRPRHEQLDVRAVQYPDKPIRRGKVLTRKSSRSSAGVGPLQGRRRRRHPVPHAARHRHAGVLHARLGPQRKAQYSERPDDYVKNNMDRLARKFETARSTCRSR
jgi:2-oxoglutarate ferredoxin oxidoreductase subunit alpha